MDDNLIENNAVIYARYSSHAQTEQSIEGQLRVCNEFAQRQGYNIIGQYIDRAISGTSADGRPEFQRMVSDAKSKQFSAVIVYKLDRFARNRYDSAVYKHKLKACNVRVVSATENISDNPEGIILEAVLEASAEYYSKELAQKVKRGINESILKGNFTGGGIPLGYKVIDKKVYIDEEKADIVRFIFESYANGMKKKDIVQALYDKDIRNCRGKPLNMNSFSRLLANKKYIGILEHDGKEYYNTYPAIIEKDLFDRVQTRLKSLARGPGAAKAQIPYLLQGKAFCGYCGARLTGECGYNKYKSKYHYYACSKKKKDPSSCTKKNEKKDFLEWYIVEQTLLYVLTPKRMEYIAEKVVEQYENEFASDKLQEYEKKILKLETQIEKTFNAALEADGSIRKMYENKLEDFMKQKEDLEIDLSRLRMSYGIHYTKQDILTWLNSFSNGDLFDMYFRKKVIETFINSVYVYDDKVLIYYNLKGGKQVSYIESIEDMEELENSNIDACSSPKKTSNLFRCLFSII